MAMTSCKECGAKISDNAVNCPSCGFKPRRTSRVTMALAILLVGGFLITVFGGRTSLPSEPAVVQAPDPEKEAASKRYGAAMAAAASLKRAARDPDSLQFESFRVSDDSSVICTAYRARNGFGGMNKAIAVFVNGTGGDDPTRWNKHCTKPLNDMLPLVQ